MVNTLLDFENDFAYIYVHRCPFCKGLFNMSYIDESFIPTNVRCVQPNCKKDFEVFREGEFLFQAKHFELVNFLWITC